MDGTRNHRPLRLRKLAGLAAVLVLTAPAGGPALAEAGAQSGEFDVATPQLAVSKVAAVAAPLPGTVEMAAIQPAIAPAAEPAIEETGEALGTGVASYYGARFAGRPTASGERFDPGQMTAAHRTLPFGSRVRVTNPSNGKSVVVRINDRGPFHKGREIDVSRAAADELGLVQRGHGPVDLVLLDD